MPGVAVIATHVTGLLQGGFRSPADVFGEIFWVFIGLGTAVGIVVIGYTLYNSYKYREGEGKGVDADVDRPQLGELPEGAGGGKKLALSFSLSAVIVIGLIIWTYSTLLYIEEPPEADMEIQVEGQQFSWQYEYPNGERTSTLHAPVNSTIYLNVTSVDVFHNYGIPGLRTKADAIPGQTSRTWFYAEEPGQYTAKCYELCGAGHSAMTSNVVIHEESEFSEWYASTNESDASAGANDNDTNGAVAVAPGLSVTAGGTP